jgi:hypothetical protein
VALSARKFDMVAVFNPMYLHCFLIHLGIGLAQWTHIRSARTILSMLLVITVLESLLAKQAVKNKLSKRVYHKPVGFAARGVVSPTVWAVGLLFGPVTYTRPTSNVVALPALNQISRDDTQTYRAREEGVERLVDCLLRHQRRKFNIDLLRL